MTIRWDACNKWLFFGANERFTIMLDDWHWRSPEPMIRKWSLFEVVWDNGWLDDLSDSEQVTIPHMNGPYIENDTYIARSGTLVCFFQVTILGIGFRWWYRRQVAVISKDRKG